MVLMTQINFKLRKEVGVSSLLIEFINCLGGLKLLDIEAIK